MNTLGLGNALVDILLKLENDDTLTHISMVRGAMDMIDETQMRAIQHAQQHLEKHIAPGGSVCNTIRAMALLGAHTGFIGKIGDDETGRFYEDALLAAGVTPHFIKTTGISGCSTILISPDGERSMATFLGPAPTLTSADLTEEILAGYDLIYIEGYLLVNEELVENTIRKAKELGVKVALDLSNFNIVNAFRPLLERIVPQLDILFSNESEAETFTGLPAGQAVRKLAEQVTIAIVTIGKEGALACTGENVVPVPAEGGKPLDTTGAGDHFAAGFLYGISINAGVEKAARIGSLLAGYAIGVVGAQIPDCEWGQIKLKVAEILR
ncbi:MAG: adenosine kinase [Tannerellaceae bacterium]|nr:adenosine kinase [Tannerellaceae bacterium]MCD8263054.1 adenosine kinase [Tannerellaceae bacterium]